MQFTPTPPRFLAIATARFTTKEKKPMIDKSGFIDNLVS